MQNDPLLEQLGWFFTSVNWTTEYPNSEVLPMAKITSDHILCKVSIGTNIPCSSLFRFEIFWVEHEGFLDTVLSQWNQAVPATSMARSISTKFKKLRSALKVWSRGLSNLSRLIANCNEVILFLDGLEDRRPLYNTESNLRHLVKRQLATLLHYKNAYWKKRYTVNRIRFGDECTKFFHAMATISHRRNSIPQLLNDQGQWVQDHEGKAGLLWNALKKRMGVSTEPMMVFDLQTLVTAVSGLEDLTLPFQHSEIDEIVRRMSCDKSPGPDGFNGLFMKRCWQIIKYDFYALCEEFYVGSANLECINSSYITLVPKIANPETVSDFKPISLLNISLKQLTKILADRLQSVILKIVHKNHNGFIRSRAIQDCLAWSFEYIHQCHQSRREAIILKLDFEKAFDTIEHVTILQMLQNFGFPDKWQTWISAVLSSGSSAILLNGVAGKSFKCKRGVRQGDPLSPLLFVIAVELLQILVNKAASQDLLKAPLPHEDDEFPIIKYADDTLLVLQADANQLFFLKALLQSYETASGLKVNYNKSQMIPINVTPERMQHLVNTFGCQIGSLPFTYLGLPMGTTKPRIDDLSPIMDRVERRLSACSTWLSYSGRLQMINSAITPIVTYTLCTIKVPKGFIENIDRARKQCLWRGSDDTAKGGNLVAWPTVMQPKEKGGLGITNLRLQNDALLLKQLHKFYNKANIPWVTLIWNKYYEGKVPHECRELGSFWWHDVMRLNVIYRGFARCTLGDGSTVSFWNDLWSDTLLSSEYPRLYSFAANKSISVQSLMSEQDLENIFFLPLSTQAHEELLSLQDYLHNIPYDEDGADSWTPTWGPKYSSRRFYAHAFSGVETHPVYKMLWKSKCTPRIKFFAWLVMVDRLNTKTMLRRRHLNIEDDELCVLCDSGLEEDIDHLFFECPFAGQCWNSINLTWDTSLSLMERLAMANSIQNLEFFTEATIIAAWELWKLRNDKIFQRRLPTTTIWLANFKNQCLLQSVRFRDDLRSSFCFWLDAFS
jgi:hypothetical protein